MPRLICKVKKYIFFNVLNRFTLTCNPVLVSFAEQGLIMKNIVSIALAATVLTSTAGAQSQSDMLENLTAVLASEYICGFNVNQEFVAVSVYSLFGDPASVSPGGKHWPEIQRNMARVEELTSTSVGRRSFCNSTRSNLSAFFD